jgi:hypothetical protein
MARTKPPKQSVPATKAQIFATMAWYTHGHPKAKFLMTGSTEAEATAKGYRWYPYLRGTRVGNARDQEGFATEEEARAAAHRFLMDCVAYVSKFS